MQGFSRINRRKSVVPIELENLDTVKKYQLALIDYLLYELNNDGIKKVEVMREGVLKEIIASERWLKKGWEEFVNNNNKNFEM